MLFIKVLRHLIAVNITINHREVLIKTIKNAEKQATTQERLNFLIQCRRNNVTPNFIRNSLSGTEKIFAPSRSFEKRKESFCRNLLNEAIQATHRTRAFLQRASARLINERHRYPHPLTRWVEQQAVMIFGETANMCHQRLEGKFRALLKSRKVTSTKTKHNRLNNMSSYQPSDELASLLEKGPKFALTQTISEKTLRETEIAIEKAINTVRWKIFWSQQTNTPRQSNYPFLPTKSHQAPRADPVTELELSLLKKKVISTYKNHKMTKTNHSKEQLDQLRNLKKNDDIIIKPSDKCKGLVIMNKSDYIAKADAITSEYEEVARNPTARTEAATKRIIRDTLGGKVEENVIRALMPQSSRTAELYGLPKDHKTNVPLRPIVSACGDPLDKISQLLEKILSQLLRFVAAHLTNTEEYLRRLSEKYPGHNLPPDSIVFSVDVTNLYGNIPYKEAIESAKCLLETHHQDIDMFGLDIPDVTHLLNHCLSNNYLRFGDKFYRQTSGIAMGSRVAPPLAVIFMDSLERRFNNTAATKPDIYMRYIDDVISVWTSGSETLQEYLEHINQVHPSIRFTMETTEHDGSLPFLDTKITVEPSGKYTTELYMKPMSSGIILHAESAQPWKVKKALVQSQIQRAIRLSSDTEAQQRSIASVKQLLTDNGYPQKAIDNAVSACTTRRPQTRSKKPVTRLVLPYIDDQLTSAVQAVVRGSDLQDLGVAWRNGCTIRGQLVRSALKPPSCPGGARCHACAAGLQGRCHTSGVVYQLTCTLCKKTYIGETGRMVRLRYNEHLRDAKNKRKDSPWGDHFSQEHQNAQPDHTTITASILQACSQDRDRKIAESLHIRERRPALNTNIASWTVM